MNTLRRYEFISSRPAAGSLARAVVAGFGIMVVKPMIAVVVSTVLGPALGVALFLLVHH
jgi:hypothetical protein